MRDRLFEGGLEFSTHDLGLLTHLKINLSCHCGFMQLVFCAVYFSNTLEISDVFLDKEG